VNSVPSVAVTAVGSGSPLTRHAHRVIFIDLARAMAVVMMVYGHTASAVLADGYRNGLWYEVWLFQRGLTSALFLLLSGFAFAVATSRHWAVQSRFSPAVARRLLRFATFIVFGYALHLPVARFADFRGAGEAQWDTFLQVDVLQLIGATFLLLQGIVLLLRSRAAFAYVMFGLAVAVIALAPMTWGVDWRGRVPAWLGPYLSPATGSQFPFFPWGAYILIGAGAGKVYARWGAADLARYANFALIVPGVALALPMAAGWWLGFSFFGSGPYAWVPWQFLIRTGAAFLILAAFAHASRHIERLPHTVSAVAQESLLVYVVHLWIVYGTIWSPGLLQAYHGGVGPAGTLAAVALVLAAMIPLAWFWNRLKHTRPRVARYATAAVLTTLVIALL
jgi:uncharacterized membrane protein